MRLQIIWAIMTGLAAVLTPAIRLAADEPKPEPPAVAAAVDLDRTYRLEFKLVNHGSSDAYVVLTSQSEFAIRYGLHKGGEEYSFDIAGRLVREKGTDRLRVSFKFALDRTNPDGDGFELGSTNSAIVDLDKPRTVALYGDYELKLTVSEAEDTDGKKPDEQLPAN